ncbi:MAG: hypothetical protein JJU02_12005 [Cryomorphaceae bacterium]|nr:hypothetical protein [Cryomorphaceae bacterium]
MPFSTIRFVFLTTLLIVGNFLHAQEGSKTLEIPETSVTEHQTTINGEKIKYTATAGHINLKNEVGDNLGHFFHIAYVAQNRGKNRPVTFVFNGGPGSSSVWLHMGALGPKRVVMTEDGLAPPPPYQVVDNEYSWLDKTDLVFIDPIETGYSRPATGVDKRKFTGYDEDIQSVGDFIRQYLSTHNRWSSPKFLAGESYGTTRAAGLSGYLQDRHGIYLNGIVLISAVLNFQTLRFEEGNDLPHILFLPSFAATAYAHGKINTSKHPSKSDFIEEVKQFAQTEYTQMLMLGDKMTEAQKENLGRVLAQYTGLSTDFLAGHHYRLSTSIFTKELLRDEGFTIGRFDALIKGRDYKSAGDYPDFDPSYNLSIFGAYTAAINAHLTETLNFHWNEKTYEILTGNVRPWNYGRAQNRFINNSPTLRSAIHKNNHLRVLICSGYYDLATPFFATDYTVDHMYLAPELRDNIQTEYYEAGHMMYSIPEQLIKFTQDVRAFYDK